MDAQKLEMIMKSSIPEEEKKMLMKELLGVKEKKKREYSTQQIEASKLRLQMARDVKKEKAKLPKEHEVQHFNEPQKQIMDVKVIEDIFEKKYSSEMAKMGDLLQDLNKNIGEMAKIKKQKAEQKKLIEDEKKKIEAEKPKEKPKEESKEESKKEISIEPPKQIQNPVGKVAFPNYRNIFGKK
jgi:hypothetical protein